MSCRLDLLKAVEQEDITWRSRSTTRGPSFRHWSSEHEYSVVTKPLKKMVAEGLIKCEMAAGFSFVTRGPVVLTYKGREVLALAAPPDQPKADDVR